MSNKKLLSCVLAAAMVSTVGIAAGCNKDSGEKLAAPEISVTGNVITWNAVENADGYNVYEGETSVSSQAECRYTITQTTPGTYRYTVVATSTDKKYSSSDKSNTVEYTVPAGDTSTKLAGKIYLVGDSTVCSFNDNYYLPRYGYGTQLFNYINCDANQISNLALSGRSSKSFVSESNYTTLKNNITAGDYLIIGFGHNDQKADIYTNPNGDKDAEGSFQNSLYTNYVKMAKDKGATPILCTPIVRLNENNDYSGSSGHVVGQVADGKPGGDYAKAIRDLGAATETTVVDLAALTKADYTALGSAKASDYHCWTATKGGVRDGLDKTHTNRYGAKMNAYHFANAIMQSENPLKANIRTDMAKPDHDTEYAASINKSYVEPNYQAPDLTKRSGLWNTVKAEGWYGSAFGDVGGATAVTATNFTVKQLSDTSFSVGNTNGKGKIASGGDGIACVFRQLDPNRNFTITADVALTGVATSASKQSAFGIMFRDEMYIDTYNASVNGNSAIAGGYTGSSDTANFVYNYQRLDGKLDITASKTGAGTVFAQNEVYKLEMVKSDRTITCKVIATDGKEYVSSYKDVTYTGVDTEYVYLCLFATRGIVATFANVNYVEGSISGGA